MSELGRSHGAAPTLSAQDLPGSPGGVRLVNFEVVPGDDSSPYIVDVPHSSTTIPDDVRRELLLGDDALTEQLRLMTDARTEELAVPQGRLPHGLGCSSTLSLVLSRTPSGCHTGMRR